VFDPAPIPVDHVVRRLPNVFLTPHIAGVTAACEPRFFDYMVDEVLRALAGHRPRHELFPREPKKLPYARPRALSAWPTPSRFCKSISEYLREMITPSAPASNTAASDSPTLSGVVWRTWSGAATSTSMPG
jgi:hypothetical protein